MSMSTMRMRTVLYTVFCALALAACSDSSVGPHGLLTLETQPARVSLKTGQAVRINLRGNGSALPSGAEQTWTSSDSSIAQVDSTGTVYAVGTGDATITAGARYNSRSGKASTSVAVEAGVTSLAVTPESLSLQPGESATLTATALDADGAAVPDIKIFWSTSSPQIARVDDSGTVVAKKDGTAQIVAQVGMLSSSTPVTVGGTAVAGPASITVTPESGTLSVDETLTAKAEVLDASGDVIDDAALTWSSSNTLVAQVTSAGVITALSGGMAAILVTSGDLSNAVDVTVLYEETAAPPPTASDNEFVVFPNERIAFIAGPQLKAGSSANPWPFFDDNARNRGLELGATAATTDTYYDFALNQYIEYYRSGDTRFLDNARTSADAWYAARAPDGTSTAPRSAALAGIILRAMDGQPEYWDWITTWTRHHYGVWVGSRLDKGTLHYGVRDGSYALMYAAMLAKVHPDAAVRSEFATKAQEGAVEYYAALQHSDGGWYWDDPDVDGVTLWSQPFMVGLTLEALILAHQISGDAAIASAITRGVDWMFEKAYATHAVPSKPEASWRGMWYKVYPPEDNTSPTGITDLAGGWDTNTIREVRQRQSTVVHSFGYAYKITGNQKYLEQGDEVFAATFGKGQGPLADPYYSLADYRAKEYNQNYRSAGRYLAWRLGR